MKKWVLYTSVLLSYLLSPLAQASTLFQYQINGITGKLLKNTQDQLNADTPAKDTVLTVQAIQQRYLKAPAEIIKALQPLGYFNAHVQARLTQHDDNWLATYTIIPGEPLRITHVQLSMIGPGQHDFKLQELFNNFPLQAGQILNMPAYNRAKQRIFNVAEAQGFMSAQLAQHEIKIDLKKYTATVILQLATGPRFYFGEVTFSANPFAESFLRRFMPFKAGEPYSAKKLLTFQDNLVNSNYFHLVSVQAQHEQTENYYVPTQVNLKPRKPQQYTLGLGYGTDTGARATLGWDWRRVTATGQRFSTLMRLSQVQSSWQAIYSIPGKNPVTDQYNLTTSILRTAINQGQSFTEQFGAADIKASGDWKRTYGLNYLFEHFQFTDQTTQHANLLIPGITWTYLKADNELYPHQGQQFSFSVQGAKETLVSSTSFVQTEIKEKYITSPTNNSRIILRGNLGYTSVHDFNGFPLSMRFYAGGTQSVRGYKYQSLGPGRYLAVGSVEYQHKIKGNWNAAVFYDAGNATNHTTARLMRAAGAGIVWKSPVGPMELVVAKALSKPGQPNQIQFNMGPDLG